MKRSIFLGIATALALVVLTAGLAYATTRWDSHAASGPAVTSQVRSGSVQPQARQAERPPAMEQPNPQMPADAQRQCDATHQQQRDREHARQGMDPGEMTGQQMAEHHPDTHGR